MKRINNNTSLVECHPEYWEFIRILRNDERVVNGFISNKHISKKMQKEYMSKNSHNYRVALVEGIPAGFIGVIENDIRVCTHPNFQGKGIGKFMINECVKIWPDAFAKVKIDNKASLKLFEACGFTIKFQILTRD